jgi:hypothetical protein
MTIPLRSHKMLWGRAANRCSICKLELVVDSTETDDEAVIGDECHIVAESQDGPRGDHPLSLEKRNKYGNLILLCKVHHKLIDDQPNTYTVDKLNSLKTEHEKWVQESLKTFDADKQHDDEIYASYIDEWEKRADLENWLGWSSHVISSGQPKLYKERDKTLQELRIWLLSRIWPKRYAKLEASFENFRLVLQDFQELFRKHAKEWGDDWLDTEKFYKIPEWNPELYDKLAKKYDFHVALVEDLMLELTRAANYVCDNIRKCIFSSYRINEGVILIESGPYIALDFKTQRVEYRNQEQTLVPYPGLKEFLKIRKFRDYHFGEGMSVDDPEFAVGDIDIDDFLNDPLTN